VRRVSPPPLNQDGTCSFRGLGLGLTVQSAEKPTWDTSETGLDFFFGVYREMVTSHRISGDIGST